MRLSIPRLSTATKSVGLATFLMAALVAGQVLAATPASSVTPGAQSGCPSQACSAVLGAVAKGAHVRSVPHLISPALRSASTDILFPPTSLISCGGGGTTVSLPQCKPDGSSPTAPRIALLGDSEAQTWAIGMDAIARRTGYTLLAMAKTECTVADLTTLIPYDKTPYTTCPEFRSYAIARIKAFNPQIIVISTLAAQYTSTNGKAISPTKYTDALAKTIESLWSPGRKIFVVSNAPHQSISPPICLAAHQSNFGGCMTSLSTSLKYDGTWQTALENAAKKAGASYINVTPWFCDGNTCPLVVANTEVYLDFGHMTSTYGVFLSWILQAALGIPNACSDTPASACNSYSPVQKYAQYTSAEVAALATP
jgi:hypothetical protein